MGRLKPGPQGLSTEERFWPKVDTTEDDECWPWTGPKTPTGYGKFAADLGVKICVMHRCDNPSCCNPAHLHLGTQADNIADMEAKGRWRGGATLKPIVHGTIGGYTAHRYRGESPCEECRAAWASYYAERRRSLHGGVR